MRSPPLDVAPGQAMALEALPRAGWVRVGVARRESSALEQLLAAIPRGGELLELRALAAGGDGGEP